MFKISIFINLPQMSNSGLLWLSCFSYQLVIIVCLHLISLTIQVTWISVHYLVFLWSR